MIISSLTGGEYEVFKKKDSYYIEIFAGYLKLTKTKLKFEHIKDNERYRHFLIEDTIYIGKEVKELPKDRKVERLSLF